MRGSFRFVVASFATLVGFFTAGCHHGRYDVSVSMGSGIAGVQYVEVVLLPQCPADVATGSAPSGAIAEVGIANPGPQGTSTHPSLPDVPPGQYGLYARGLDGSCTPIAAGCVPVTLRGGGSGSLSVPLTKTTSPTAACASSACMNGHCEPVVADASMDASMGGDAGPDASMDASMDATASTDGAADADAAISCHASCQTCSGTGINQCTSCRTGGTLSGGECTYTCTLTSSADGMAWNYLSTGSSGTGAVMNTTDDGASHYYAFVRFDVANGTCAETSSKIPSGSTILGATLRLHWESGCMGCTPGHELRKVTASWSDSAITPGTGPSVSATATTTVMTLGTGMSPTDVDVTGGTLLADVQSFFATPSGNYGWRFGQLTGGTSNNATPYAWTTHESAATADAPRLVITYR